MVGPWGPTFRGQLQASDRVRELRPVSTIETNIQLPSAPKRTFARRILDLRRYAYADHPAIQARAALFHLEDVMGRPDQEHRCRSLSPWRRGRRMRRPSPWWPGRRRANRREALAASPSPRPRHPQACQTMMVALPSMRAAEQWMIWTWTPHFQQQQSLLLRA